MACQFQSVASTAPFLAGTFAIDFAGLGTLIGLYMLPGIFIALPGGMLGQRFGTKKLVLAGLLLMVLGGCLMGASTSFLPLAAGRLISGVGAVLINVLMTKMVVDWFAGREIVTAMAILVASWPFGLALGLLLFTPLAVSQSWNAVMYAAALMALASLLLMALTYRDPVGMPAGSSSGLNLTLTRNEWLSVSLAGSIWTSYTKSH
jgi:predicted MFS family arabinose efflux permease